jgi:hypothetical protein
MPHHLFISASTVCLEHRFAGNFVEFTFTRSLRAVRSRELSISIISKKLDAVTFERSASFRLQQIILQKRRQSYPRYFLHT